MSEDNDDQDDLQFQIFFENLKRKLDDEKIVKKIYDSKREIENALGCQIIISIANVEEEYAEEIFNSINNIGIDKSTNTMKLGFLIDYLSSEDKNLGVYIDPIHLKTGLNPLANMVLVPMDDYIILVPKSEV
jgi:hypothetical protein